jgi:hypothetical protein
MWRASLQYDWLQPCIFDACSRAVQAGPDQQVSILLCVGGKTRLVMDTTDNGVVRTWGVDVTPTSLLALGRSEDGQRHAGLAANDRGLRAPPKRRSLLGVS